MKRKIHRERVNVTPCELTPREAQILARHLTGYGPIRLYSTDDGDIAVAVVAGTTEIEVIRTFVGDLEGTVDHWITPSGIQDEFRRAFGEADFNPRLPKKRRRKP